MYFISPHVTCKKLEEAQYQVCPPRLQGDVTRKVPNKNHREIETSASRSESISDDPEWSGSRQQVSF